MSRRGSYAIQLSVLRRAGDGVGIVCSDIALLDWALIWVRMSLHLIGMFVASVFSLHFERSNQSNDETVVNRPGSINADRKVLWMMKMFPSL